MQSSTTTTSLLSKNRLPPESEQHEGREEVSHRLKPAYARSPLMPIVICFVVGILLDQTVSVSWVVWASLILITTTMWVVLFLKRSHRVAALLLMVSFLALGGIRHHLFWSMAAEGNIQQLLNHDSQLIKIKGLVITEPVIIKEENQPFRSAWQRYDRSRCTVDCSQLATNDGWQPITGKIGMNISGHLLSVHAGQEIEVTGWASLPRGPMNPGQFDFRKKMKRQGTAGLLYVNHPDAIIVQNDSARSYLSRWFSQLRREINQNFVQQLAPKNVPLAEALLLGQRTSMSGETRDAFAQSGMMHVLAISGLHIGLLAALVWGICRLLKLSYPLTALSVFVVILFCAILVEARPPILRATIFIAVALLGKVLMKRVRAGNLIAITLLLMLAWNPTDLFEVGTQLSFLAVMGIFFYAQISPVTEPEDAIPVEEIEPTNLINRLQLASGQGYIFLKRSVLMMGCIWLFSLPMVMSQFHLVSPVGFLLNILLLPVVVITLWLGYFFMFVGYLLPWLLPMFGSGFDIGLTLLRSSVHWGASQGIGHQYVSGPDNWWLIGYYCLLLSMVIFWWRVRKRLWLWSLLGSWIVFGLFVGIVPSSKNELRCTFLSVGHGCAVLVEMPNGKTLLYDAGSIQDSKRAERAVENSFWEAGYRQLDAIVISHADIDHFNGVPGLLQKVPVGSLLVARPFLKFEQASVKHLCDSARREQVPIQLLSSNDKILLDESVSIKVLHPPAKWNSKQDNASSIALEITYAGQTILLLGDLEKEGMTRMLELPSINTAALLSPHHGSLKANPQELANWATPEHVIVSGGHKVPINILQERFGKTCTLYSTSEIGAVTITITKEGKVHTTTFGEEDSHDK